MYPETPYIARVNDELVRRALVDNPGNSDADPVDEHAHAIYFLLQEICGFSLRFNFKGALVPYAIGLENVLRDLRTSRSLVAVHFDETEITDDDLRAVARLEQLSRPPQGFAGDARRWQSLLAAYVFLAWSPMYVNGFGDRRYDDFVRFYGSLYAPAEVTEVVRFIEAQQIEPART